jgi:hypothetical protein
MRVACENTPWVTSLEQDLQWGWGVAVEKESLDAADAALGMQQMQPVVHDQFGIDYRVHQVHPGVADNGCPRTRVDFVVSFGPR